MKLKFQTFGCKVNTYDTGLLQKKLSLSDRLCSSYSNTTVMVVNTCAVTGEATKEAIRWMRKYKKENPSHRLVVTGCSAQVDTELIAQEQDVDLVVANSHKGDISNLIQSLLDEKGENRIYKSNIFKKLDLESEGGQEDLHTRAFIKIQDGCNSFCTFCVIPFARGKSRSVPAEIIIGKIRELSNQNIKEVVLTGVHIGDYEDDKVKNLEELLRKVLKETSMPRIRLTSLEPIELTPELLDLYAQDRMCKHFHMSIQSANSRVLSAMKRKYSSDEVESSLSEIYKNFPEAYVGMDVIVGFPGESEQEYFDTYERLNNLPWTRIHVFPYSKRPGTYADKLGGQHQRGEILSRARRLRELSFQRSQSRALEQVGSTKDVLILSSGKKGLSRDYWPVDLPDIVSRNFKVGSEVSLRITDINQNVNPGLEPRLVGTLL